MVPHANHPTKTPMKPSICVARPGNPRSFNRFNAFNRGSFAIACWILLLGAFPSFAQTIAYDDAGNYVVDANWTNGANQGFGFTPWMILTNGPDFHGTYVNAGTNPLFVIATVTNVAGTNYGDVWGIFANGT